MIKQLPDIVRKAVEAAGNDSDAQSEIIEVQARCLGTSVAMMTRGDARVTNDLLEGAAAYAMEQAASVHAIYDLVRKLGR